MGDNKMKQFKSVDEILDFAIAKEEEASNFYSDLAKRMQRAAMKKVFEDFSREELSHKAKLMAVKSGKLLLKAKEKVLNLKIAEYVSEVPKTGDFDYQKALILAMNREKESFKLYSDLASTTDDAGIRETFLALAQEEAKHKLRIELEYDERILGEN